MIYVYMSTVQVKMLHTYVITVPSDRIQISTMLCQYCIQSVVRTTNLELHPRVIHQRTPESEGI